MRLNALALLILVWLLDYLIRINRKTLAPITLASFEGSGEPVQMHRLPRAFSARTYKARNTKNCSSTTFPIICKMNSLTYLWYK